MRTFLGQAIAIPCYAAGFTTMAIGFSMVAVGAAINEKLQKDNSCRRRSLNS